jgi:hypothetical protein
MPEKEPSPPTRDQPKPPLPLGTYVYRGGITGFLVGIVTTLVLGSLYAHTLGLAVAKCVTFGCLAALLLSHPAGLCGMAMGAAGGAVVGAIAHRVRHSPRVR